MRTASKPNACASLPTSSRKHARISASSMTRSGFACSIGCWRPAQLMTLALALMVCGCGTTPTRAWVPDPPRPDLLTPCARPGPATSDQGKPLVANHVEGMTRFDDCAIKQAELAAWAREVTTPVIERMWWERLKWRKN